MLEAVLKYFKQQVRDDQLVSLHTQTDVLQYAPDVMPDYIQKDDPKESPWWWYLSKTSKQTKIKTCMLPLIVRRIVKTDDVSANRQKNLVKSSAFALVSAGLVFSEVIRHISCQACA